MKYVKFKGSLPISFEKRYPGVRVNGDRMEFPDHYTQEQINELYALATRSEVQRETRLKAYAATDQDKAVVKGLMKDPKIDVSNFGYYELVASSTSEDSHRERVTKRLLDVMAEDYKAKDGLPGRSLLINHQSNSFAGATFDSRMEARSDGGWDLIVKVYVDDTLVHNGNNIKRLVDAGSISFASAQFRYGSFTEEKVADNYWIGILDIDPEGKRKSEAIELSLVYKGANPDSRVKKDAPEIVIKPISNMTSQKSYYVGIGEQRKEYVLKFTGGENPAVDDVNGLQTAITALVEENAALKSEKEADRKPIREAISALEAKLEMPKTPESALKVYSMTELLERQKFLEGEDQKRNPKNQTTEDPTGAKSADPKAGEQVWVDEFAEFNKP